MEKFKKKLINIAGASPVYLITIIVIAIALAAAGLLLNNSEEVKPFDGSRDGLATMDALFLDGPFAEETEGSSTTREFYLAYATDDMWYVIATKPNSEIPVYGVDIWDEDFSTLKAQTVTGTSEKMPSDLVPYLVDFCSEVDVGIDTTNYAYYFGTHYLDTTTKTSHDWDILYMLAVLLLVIGLLPGLGGNKRRKLVKQRLDEFETNGQLNTIYNDFSVDEPIYSSKLKLALSHHYLLDVASQSEGLRVIPLSSIDSVYRYNMIAGQPTVTNFIALENEERMYVVAQSVNRTKQFNQVLEQLKADVERGKTLQ